MKKIIALTVTVLTMLTLTSCLQKLDGDGMENTDTTQPLTNAVSEENDVSAVSGTAENINPENMQ